MFKAGFISKVVDVNHVVAAGAALALFAGGFLGHAEARMPEGDRMSATAQECGFLQDQFDSAYFHMTHAKTDEEQADAASQVRYFMDRWYAPIPGCSNSYGEIAYIQSAPQANLSHLQTTGLTSSKAKTSVAGMSSANGTASR